MTSTLKGKKDNWQAIGKKVLAKSSTSHQLVVKLTDNPGDYEGLEVEIAAVKGYSPLLGWIPFTLDTIKVDVLELTNGVESQIAHCPSCISSYYVFTKLHIQFGVNNYLKYKCRVPYLGYFQSKVVQCGFEEINSDIYIDLFDPIRTVSEKEILLDFNVAQSVKWIENGYSLYPRITQIVDRFTGIRGKINVSNKLVLFITDYINTYSCFTNGNGEFLIRGIKSGYYTILAYGHSKGKAGSQKRIIAEDIKVEPGQITCLD